MKKYTEFDIKLPFEEKDIDSIQYVYESTSDGDKSTKIVHLKDGRKFRDGVEIKRTKVVGIKSYPKQGPPLEEFGEFISADKIAYKDLDDGELYTIHKEGQVFEIRISSNKIDGGWANFRKKK